MTPRHVPTADFDVPSVPPAKPERQLRTLGMLTSQVEDAIRSIDGKTTVSKMTVTPEFNVDRSTIIAAEVVVKFSVIGEIER